MSNLNNTVLPRHIPHKIDFLLDEGKSEFPHVRHIRNFALIIAVAWVLLLSASFSLYYFNQLEGTEAVVRAEARAAFGRDILYRRWASSHGGVYAPVTDQTQPNPYLAHIAERDIKSPSGRALTLINPAFMTRQVYELAKKQEGVGRGHITSLNPIRPENIPDPWEAKVLRSFEQGIDEVFEIQDIDGKPHMRLMRPFVTEAPCLKCHATQGYRTGDIRGGISVSIPMQLFLDISRNEVTGVAAAHGILLVFGIGIIGYGARSLVRSSRVVEESELRYRTVADFTSGWEYWLAPDGSFRYMSPSCEQISGYTPDDFYNNPQLLTQIIHPDDLELYSVHIHTITDKGIINPFDFRIISKGGDCRWISHVCRTIYDTNGQQLGQRASNRDITQRKNAEEEVSRLNTVLEQRVIEAVDELRHKDQLLIQQSRLAGMGEMIGNIAHQWRQPLNNVALIIQNIQIEYDSGTLSREEMDNNIQEAMKAILQMSQTIDDFRNFFRVDKEKQKFLVRKVVDRALSIVSSVMDNHNFQVKIEADEEVTATGYQNEYAQVLLNIISNAREAGRERNILNPFVFLHITNENDRSVLYIRDNCGGIPDDILPKIFDPYFTTRGPDRGTGIGLYMSKVIIEQNMSGRLTARNVNGGAEFRIEV